MPLDRLSSERISCPFGDKSVLVSPSDLRKVLLEKRQASYCVHSTYYQGSIVR